MWKTCQLSETFYERVLRYKHNTRVDGVAKRFVTEPNLKSLPLFWLSLVPTSAEVIFAFAVIYEHLSGNKVIPLYILIINVALACIGLLTLSLNYLLYKHSHDIVTLSMNSLIQFDTRLNGRGEPSEWSVVQLAFRGNKTQISTLALICPWTKGNIFFKCREDMKKFEMF